MSDDLNKVERFLGLPDGSLLDVLWRKRKDQVVIERLKKEGVILDEHLRLKRSCRDKWWALRKKAGLS